MDKSEICKICNKHFPNGKAMAGHVRSHLRFAKPNSKKNFSPPTSSSSSSSCSSLNYSLESCPKLAMKPASVTTLLSNPSGAIGSTEAESWRNLTRRRSKRKRKPTEKISESMHFKVGDDYYSDPMRVSSSTFASEDDYWISVEGVATILLMLYYGHDKIMREKEKDQVAVDASIDNKFVEEEEEEIEEGEIREEKEVEDKEEEKEEEDPFDDSDTDAPDPIKTPKFSASKASPEDNFRCEECDRGFKSYQALGGHMASHKKMKPNGTSNKETCPKYEEEDHLLQARASGGLAIGRRVFKCSFCDKEFESGQALGGHKKVHFPYLGNNPRPNPKTNGVVENMINLKLLPQEPHRICDQI